MHIGILQTGAAPDALRPDHGDYPDAFERLLAAEGFRFTTWRVEEMEFPPSIDAADGWLITGSRHGAYEDHPFIRPLEAFIRAALGAGVPVVGICFGHQIMAQAMGGRVERFAGGWAVGPTLYDFGGETLTLNAWHRDQVVAVPPGAEVIAENPRCAVAGLVYGTTGFSVQAHPELSNAFIDGLMRTRGPGLVPDDLMAEARARMTAEPDSPTLSRRIGDFFRAAHARRAPVAEAAHG